MILVHLNWAVIFPPNLKVYRFTGTSRRTRSVSWTRRTSRSRWRTTTSCPRWKGARPRSSKATSRGTKTGSSSSDRIEITLMTSLATNLLCTYYSTQTYKSSTMVSSQINQTWDQLKCIYFSDWLSLSKVSVSTLLCFKLCRAAEVSIIVSKGERNSLLLLLKPKRSVLENEKALNWVSDQIVSILTMRVTEDKHIVHCCQKNLFKMPNAKFFLYKCLFHIFQLKFMH